MGRSRVFSMIMSGLALKHKLGVLSSSNLEKQKEIMLDGTEKSMIPIIANSSKTIIGSFKKIVSIEEFSAGTGIADIVLCSYDPKIIKCKKTKPVTDRRLLETYLLLLKFSEGLSFEQIHAQLEYGQNELKTRIIPELMELDLLDINENTYKLHKRIDNHGFNKVIAVEAKVRDWRSCFKQAIRYQEFADESYLAMYERYISPCLQFEEAFKTAGIGLIGVSDKGVSVHIQATNVSQYNKHINRMLAYERISTFINDAYQPFVIRQPFATRI